MKCPNCQFELKNPGPNCPFCQFVLPQAEDETKKERTQEAPAADSGEAGSAVPTPGGGSAEPTFAEPAPESPSPVFEPPVVKPPPQGGGVKTIAVLAGAFLLFKVGAFDNILMLFGLGASPAESVPAASTDPLPLPEPAPLTAEDDAREAAASAASTASMTPMKEQTFDPLDDPRMKALNAEVEKKLESSGPKPRADRPAARGEEPPDAAEAAAESSADDWVFQGRLYDMISLKPVAGAELMLMDSGEQNIFTARSDAKGRYEFDVPAVKGGYRLVVDHPYYLADYFDEKNPPYAKSPLSARRQLRAARPTHKPWIGSGKPVRRDVILYPEIPDR